LSYISFREPYNVLTFQFERAEPHYGNFVCLVCAFSAHPSPTKHLATRPVIQMAPKATAKKAGMWHERGLILKPCGALTLSGAHSSGCHTVGHLLFSLGLSGRILKRPA